MGEPKTTPLRHVSNRELWARMYAYRDTAPRTDEERLDEVALWVEWNRRLSALRGPKKRGRRGRHREQRVARFVVEMQAYFAACTDRDRLWCDRMKLLAERVETSEKKHLELVESLEPVHRALASAGSSRPANEPLSARDRAALAWGLGSSAGLDARGRSKGEPS